MPSRLTPSPATGMAAMCGSGVPRLPAVGGPKPVVRRLLGFNAHDPSEFDGRDLGLHGEFGYPYLDHYWTEDDRHPFPIEVDGRGSPLQIAEFVVLRRFRRRGVGLAAARAVLRRLSGSWQVHVVEGNDAGVVAGCAVSRPPADLGADKRRDRAARWPEHSAQSCSSRADPTALIVRSISAAASSDDSRSGSANRRTFSPSNSSE